MYLSERLNKDQQKKEENKKKRMRGDFDEDEETMTYMAVPKSGYLNDYKGAYKGFGDTGINNAPSIYDAQAIFKTKN